MNTFSVIEEKILEHVFNFCNGLISFSSKLILESLFMTYPSIAKFFPLSSITKLYSIDSIEEKYSRESFEDRELNDMLVRQKEFVEQVLNPCKDENDYWETWYLRLSLIQKTTFIGILIIGYYNIEGAKFLKSKKVIMINPQLQFSIGLFPLITITKEVVKST